MKYRLLLFIVLCFRGSVVHSSSLTDVQSKSLLKYAEDDNIEVVRGLLEQGADPNFKDEDGRTPLYKAAENNRAKVHR